MKKIIFAQILFLTIFARIAFSYQDSETTVFYSTKMNNYEGELLAIISHQQGLDYTICHITRGLVVQWQRSIMNVIDYTLILDMIGDSNQANKKAVLGLYRIRLSELIRQIDNSVAQLDGLAQDCKNKMLFSIILRIKEDLLGIQSHMQSRIKVLPDIWEDVKIVPPK